MGEGCDFAKGDPSIVLRRKPRRRYLSILHSGSNADSLDVLSRRCADLFGEITLEKAGLRLMSSDDGMIIIRCSLPQIHSILVSIPLVNPPMVCLGMSGSISRLKKRVRESQTRSDGAISRFK